MYKTNDGNNVHYLGASTVFTSFIIAILTTSTWKSTSYIVQRVTIKFKIGCTKQMMAIMYNIILENVLDSELVGKSIGGGLFFLTWS